MRIQAWVSGAVPRWMSVSMRAQPQADRARAAPSPITTSPPWWRTRPTGVITAAVPQAKTSVSSPVRGALAPLVAWRSGARSTS